MTKRGQCSLQLPTHLTIAAKQQDLHK
jgi:hypothetical protein